MAIKNRFVHNNNNTAICYYRYSSSAQRDVSIEQQQKAAHEYADAHGMIIVKEYIDRAKSGTDISREDLANMMYEAKTLRPGYLILWKGDRLFRDRYNAAIYKRELREMGIKIEYVAETMPEDDAERELLEGIEEAIAHHYVLQHAKNVERGLRSNAEKAWYNGRKILGYTGKANHRYEIDTNTAHIVQRIFKEYADGVPAKKICDDLNEAGFVTARGKSFTPNSLWHILQNRSYIGEYRWNDIVIPDGFPRLVSDEMFLKVQEMMQTHKHGGRGEATRLHPELGIEFWLTGHLYCKKCGCVMNGVSGTGKKGKIYYYYTCMDKKRHKCDVKPVRKEVLELIVTGIMNELINDSSLRIIIANKVFEHYQMHYASEDNYEATIKNNLRDCEKKLSNIMRAIEAGIFNETTAAAMSALEEQKRILNDELVAEQARKEYRLTPELVLRYLEQFVGKAEDATVRRKILDSMIDKIYVDDESVTVTFYFSDDKRKIDINDYLESQKRIEYITGYLEHHEMVYDAETLKNSGLLPEDFFG